MKTGRRNLLKLGAALASGGLLSPIQKALAIEARGATGTIKDVEHVVILMQENRSFDHYFGTLRGVRGFGDPRPLRLPDGGTVFQQPVTPGDPSGGHLTPFRMNAATTCGETIKSLDHSWRGSIDEWKHFDVWVPKKTPMTMGYFTREDIPFYYALADAFTLCDAYYCSLHGPTNPNRMFLFTGTNGISVGDAGPQAVHNTDDGNWTSDMARDNPDKQGFKLSAWTTYAERLQAAGINWQVYQEYDNYGDNSLAYFKQFRNMDPKSDLHRRARGCAAGSTIENTKTSRGDYLVAAIAADVQANRLPQVSWVVAPYAQCEHPTMAPSDGESFVSRVLGALTSNPEVWAKTVFLINYDENDGFFDHVPAFIPALKAAHGQSTVDVAGESFEGEPVGLGLRVPMLVISPWSKGGWVNSQVFDHTSVIRFLETRFGVMEPNITPWRRAMCGDLTTAFDFSKRNSERAKLPDPEPYAVRLAQTRNLPQPQPQASHPAARQEPGQRPARPLPYDLQVTAETDGTSAGVRLNFINAGSACAGFNVHTPDRREGPWFYTVEAGKRLNDTWRPSAVNNGRYDLTVYGPNGFLRAFAGTFATTSKPEVSARYVPEREEIVLELRNPGTDKCAVSVSMASIYGNARPRSYVLAAGEKRDDVWPLAKSDRWYDLTVTVEGDKSWRRRLAGHMETGQPSRSDPALGATSL